MKLCSLIKSSLLVVWLAWNIFPASPVWGVTLNWSPVDEPGVGGWITSIEISPHNSNRILVGGDILGIGLSTDGGATWDIVNGLRTTQEIEEFTFHPTDTFIVWAATQGGPFLSTDRGVSWTKKRSGFPAYESGKDVAPVQKILIDPSNTSRLLAFTGSHRIANINNPTNYGKVYESTNNGDSWTLKSTIDGGKRVTTAVYKTGTNNTIYAATSAGVYISTNDGGNWTRKISGMPGSNPEVNWIAVHPTNGDIAWAAIKTSGIYKTTNGGDSWSAANSGISPINNDSRFDLIEVAPTNGDVLYCSDTLKKKSWKSTDGGSTWVSASNTSAFVFGDSAYPKNVSFSALSFDPNNSNRVFGGNAMIWKTTNGRNWTDVSATKQSNGNWRGTGYSGLVPHGETPFTVNGFKWNPFNTNESMVLAMDGGKWRSTDNMQTWKRGGTNMDSFYGLVDVAYTSTSGTFYALQGQNSIRVKLYKTTNGGDSWSETNRPVTSGQPGGIYANPNNPSEIWFLHPGQGNIYRSVNSGSTWNEVGSNTGFLESMTGDPENPGVIYVAGGSGVWKTTNGTSFTKLGLGSGTTRVKIHPTNRDIVYAVRAKSTTGKKNRGVWRYNPGSGTWTHLKSTNEETGQVRKVVDVAVDPTNTNRILVATNEDATDNNTAETGVWMSEDGGTNWSQQNAGLPLQRIRCIRFKPDSDLVVIGLNGRGYYKANTGGGGGGGGGGNFPNIESVSEQDSGTPASNLLDGNTADNSRWSANGFPQNVVIDYGSSKSITGTRLWTYQNRAYRFRIEVSNSPNSGFTTVVDRTNNTSGSQPISNDFSAVTGRYVKITVTGASGYGGSWVSLTEFEIVEGTGGGGGSGSFPNIESVSAQQSPHVAENLLDGNPADSSRWSAQGFPQSVIIDNGPSPAAYNQIRVWTYQNRAYQYKIWGSDNLASVQNEDPSKLRVDRSNNTSSGQPITNTTSGYPWRYLKIKFTGASGYSGSWVSITEIDTTN